MRYLSVILLAACFLLGCSKDEFTTVPQIKFKSFKPDQASNQTPQSSQPVMVLEITDAEGDIGFRAGKDTSKVYIKNTLTNKLDSMLFPDILTSSKKDFKADIEIGLFSVLGGRNLPSNQRPYADTLRFEVYVVDFAKNKSNVILTDKPFIYFTLP